MHISLIIIDSKPAQVLHEWANLANYDATWNLPLSCGLYQTKLQLGRTDWQLFEHILLYGDFSIQLAMSKVIESWQSIG